MAKRIRVTELQPILPKVPFEKCPIATSLGVLGHKWALLVLRDVSFFKDVTFGKILRNNPGLTPRVLSMRLRELRREGFLERVANPENGREIYYRIAPKGEDVMPVLAALIQFGIQHYPERVFQDGKARGLQQVFPDRQGVLLGRLADYADAATNR